MHISNSRYSGFYIYASIGDRYPFIFVLLVVIRTTLAHGIFIYDCGFHILVSDAL